MVASREMSGRPIFLKLSDEQELLGLLGRSVFKEHSVSLVVAALKQGLRPEIATATHGNGFTVLQTSS